ncbi:hypothetical protein N7488_004097 [Penicillium malachiteum]|nr:hypothetical protein N7488_004097 [Penicillium malachiteum]
MADIGADLTDDDKRDTMIEDYTRATLLVIGDDFYITPLCSITGYHPAIGAHIGAPTKDPATLLGLCPMPSQAAYTLFDNPTVDHIFT